jgi:hypothetical protein
MADRVLDLEARPISHDSSPWPQIGRASRALSFAAAPCLQAGDQFFEIGRLSIVVNGHILT